MPGTVPKMSEPIREKIYNREERYQKMLTHIWHHVKNDDRISVSNIFEQYEGVDMGFI